MKTVNIAIDFETPRIKEGRVHPTPVVLSKCVEGMEPTLHTDDWETQVVNLLTGTCTIWGQNLSFDMWCSIRGSDRPDFMAALWIKAIEDGRTCDLILYEKLGMLQRYGSTSFLPNPDGSVTSVQFSLADMALRYLGKDISDTKTEDSWRLNYDQLKGVPLKDWPQDAVDYAKDDTALVHEIRNQMDDCGVQIHHPLMVSLMKASFAVSNATGNGMLLDPFRAQGIFQDTREIVRQTDRLVEQGIYEPPTMAMPYANGAKAHVEGCDTPKQRKNCNCPPKMKAPATGTMKAKILRTYIREWLVENFPQIKLELTDGGKEAAEALTGRPVHSVHASDPWLDDKPQFIKLNKTQIKEVLKDFPERTIQQWVDRERGIKLWTSFFPGMMWDVDNNCSGRDSFPDKGGNLVWATTVHPNFDVLKRSGRMSSYAGKLYPSCNVQQADPRIRPAYVARPGNVLVCSDFVSLELYAAASKWKRLFGYSKLHDMLSAGVDPHAYLAAQLSASMDPKSPIGHLYDDMKRYEAFKELKGNADIEYEGKPYYDHWRTFAKPVGLGFPGGLGLQTMVTMAFTVYGVSITKAEAKAAREVWKQTFPEAKQYLEVYMNDQQDSASKKYSYMTALGMFRPGCSYAAAANGGALQSDPAEGMRLACFEIVKESFEPESPLYGSLLLAPVHDEVIVEISEGSTAAMERLEEILVNVMSGHLDIDMKVETAVMYRWHKKLPRDQSWAKGHRDFDPRVPIDPKPDYARFVE